jgi:hypothetical protein
MKKLITTFLILFTIACGSVPKSSSPNMCLEEKEELKNCQNQKQVCTQENESLKTVLKYALPALGFLSIGFVAGQNTK